MHRSGSTPLAFVLVLAGLASSPTALVASDVLCFGGDIRRSHRLPDAQLPVDGKVLWRSPIANWGWSQPIVVGDRVLLTYEPGFRSDFPHLVCYDSRSGEELWDRELDHFDVAVGKGRASALRKDLHAVWRKMRDGYRLINETEDLPAGEAMKILREAGFSYDKETERQLRGRQPMRNIEHAAWTKERLDRLREAGVHFDVFIESGHGLQVVGHSFPAPVSDGELVYVVTAWGGMFAFDLDGRPRWHSFCKTEGKTDTFVRSPLTYEGLVIADVGNVVRAVDKRTGRIVWQHDYQNAGTMTSPAVLTVDGVDILVGEGMNVFRLPDGKPLAVDGWSDTGTTIVVKYDEPNVAFFVGGGEHGAWEGKGKTDTPPPAAVSFALQGETLKATVLWSGALIDGERKPITIHASMVYQDGRLYTGFKRDRFIIDASDGTLIRGEQGRRGEKATPRSMLNFWLTEKHVVGLHDFGNSKDGEERRGRLGIYTLAGEPVSEMILEQAPDTEAKLEKVRRQVLTGEGKSGWRFSYGCPFVPHGRVIYVRSADELICIGP